MDSVLNQLLPWAVKLETLSRFYGVRVGHFNNGRQVGFIDLDFDFELDTQFTSALGSVLRVLGPDHPFEVLHDNSFDEERKCTYSTIRLMLWDDINLDTPELHAWELEKSSRRPAR